jgi:polygalacturonase
MPSTFDVRALGATGVRTDNATPALQAAIDAASAAGGGMVYVPPGEYTTGTLHLRSHVRVHVEQGATLFGSMNAADYPGDPERRAVFYAEDQHDIGLEGLGTIEGQGHYEWRTQDWKDWYILPNQLLAEELGLSLERSFPAADTVGKHLVLFIRCQDVRIENLTFLNSPFWTMHLFQLDRLLIQGVNIRTSQRDGVWADGIDPDGCRDVHIDNCTIETGDDALVFYDTSIYGPVRASENITVTNCRLSSSSSALKFCDGNHLAIRNVVISNCVITNSNRGLAFMVFGEGVIENVVISNVTIECRRFDWFWWGDGDPIHFNLIRYGDIVPDRADEVVPIGAIRNVQISNVIARGPGPNKIHGHPESYLENIAFDNVRLTVDADVDAPWRKGEHALAIDNARNVTFRNVEIDWEGPVSDHWRSAFAAERVEGLTLDGVSARQAQDGGADAALVLHDVTDATVRDGRAHPGTVTYLAATGAGSDDILFVGNDTRHAERLR